MKTLKNYFIIAVLFMLASQSAFTQYYFKSYDFSPFGTRNDIGRSIEKRTPSNGWSIAGYTNTTTGGYDWTYTKLNAAGIPVCTATLGFSLADSCFSHIEINSNNPPFRRAVLSGFYRNTSGIEKASWSILDSSCVHLLSKQILDTAKSQYRQTSMTPYGFANSGFIQMYSNGAYKNKMLVTNYSFSGSMSWGYKYFSYTPSNDEAYSICYQPVGTAYCVAGRTNALKGYGTKYDVLVMKLTSAGIPSWKKIYKLPASVNSNAYKIIPMTDGGYVICGWTNMYDTTTNDIWVLRINTAGTVMWSYTYGYPGVNEIGHSIVYNASNNTLTLTGYLTSASNEEILTGNINAATGAVNWFKKYSNPSGNDRGYDIETASSPDGYGVSGHLYTPASVSQDQFLMRTDLLGIITPGCVDALGLIQRPLQSVSDTLQLNYTQVQDIQINPTVISQAVTVRNLCGLTGVNENNNSIPETYKLEQNYPNPFNPSTTIKFSLPEDGKISLKVHDITGKVIANLEDGFKNKGNYSVEFNASNLPSGIYFYTLSAGRVTETKKMILIK